MNRSSLQGLPSPPLAGAVVLVTGGGAGIGTAIAEEVSRRGAHVGVTDSDPTAASAVAERLTAGGARSCSALVDVTDPSSIRAGAEAVESALGPITHWVSNAGVSSMGRFAELSEAEWDRNMDVNAKGVFLCGQEAARRFANRGGVIVNIASMAGKQGRVPYLAHYVASKFAVVGLTQAMAFELAAVGIRVNCVCPGFVATAMQDRELHWEAELRGVTPDEIRDGWIASTPMARLEQPGDVAVAVAYLCSDDSRFVTGEALAVNGGAYMD